MIKFIKLKDPDNHFDQSDVEMTIYHEGLSEVVEEFICFLKACGYSTKDLEQSINGDYDCE